MSPLLIQKAMFVNGKETRIKMQVVLCSDAALLHMLSLLKYFDGAERLPVMVVVLFSGEFTFKWL